MNKYLSMAIWYTALVLFLGSLYVFGVASVNLTAVLVWVGTTLMAGLAAYSAQARAARIEKRYRELWSERCELSNQIPVLRHELGEMQKQLDGGEL
jgi:hypothetical protein